MAMTGAGMGSAINAAVAAIPGIQITDTAEAQAYHDALGNAIVAYIQASATVLPGTFSNGGGAVGGTGTVE